MRRLIIAIVIMIIITLICCIEILCVNNIYTDSSEKLTQAVTYMENDNYTYAKETVESLEKYWIRVENLLSTFVNHEELYEIGTSIGKLKALANREEKDTFFAEAIEIKILLLHIKNYENLNFKGIF
ncbi:MAG: DUF4363 family protein [bacterium]|nr:DUF4363 family protein [bacterium]